MQRFLSITQRALTLVQATPAVSAFSPRNVIDGRRDTYWTTSDQIKPPELIINLRREQTFNVVRVREYLPLGQRVEAFAVESWKDDEWLEFARGASIGNCKLLRGKPVTTTKVRLRITQSPVAPQSLSSRYSLSHSKSPPKVLRLMVQYGFASKVRIVCWTQSVPPAVAGGCVAVRRQNFSTQA